MINFLKKYNDYSTDDIKRLRYGLEGIYLTLTKTIVIILVAFLLNILLEVIFGIILFNIIRYFAFGFHAEKSFECLLLSLFNFVLIPYLLLNINTYLLTNAIICGICLVLIVLFAPADTINRNTQTAADFIERKDGTFWLIVAIRESYQTEGWLSVLAVEQLKKPTGVVLKDD
jgi:accessory gene regulator B